MFWVGVFANYTDGCGDSILSALTFVHPFVTECDDEVDLILFFFWFRDYRWRFGLHG